MRFSSNSGGLCSVTLAAAMLATPVVAATIDVNDSHGGIVANYKARWSAAAARGDSVRVVGPCQSACTVLIGEIPRDRICVTPAAQFGFHLAKTPAATAMLRAAYDTGITAWIDAHGGLTQNFIWMHAPDTYKFFKRC